MTCSDEEHGWKMIKYSKAPTAAPYIWPRCSAHKAARQKSISRAEESKEQGHLLNLLFGREIRVEYMAARIEQYGARSRTFLTP